MHDAGSTLLDYELPRISELSGCDGEGSVFLFVVLKNGAGNITALCPRGGGANLTITGTGFGSSQLQV